MVARQTLLGSWFRRLIAGIIVVISLVAGAVMTTRLPDAQAEAPKQQPQQQSQPPKPAQIDRNEILG